MKTIVLFSLTLLLFSCSSALKNIFQSDEVTAKRNEKLMKEDFKVKEDVLSKFQENKTEIQKSESKNKKEKINLNSNKVLKQKVESKKVEKKRVAIKPKPKKFKKNQYKTNKKQPSIVNKYRDDFPEDLIDLDDESKKYWNTFSPTLFPGEKTILNISYMGVSTGKITIQTKPETRLGKTDVYHMKARVKTADFYSYLYEVDDHCDSYISKENFLPLKFSLIQRQSSQDIDDLQLFDHAKKKTYSFYKRVTKEKKKKKKKIKDIPRFFQDPLSVLYFIRGLPMVAGKTYGIPLVNQGKVEALNATFEKIETIKTAIGEKKAYKVKISTKHSGKTIKGGKMTFWFSADERRIFLKFNAKIKIGTVNGEIESYKE